jgi:DNA-directed RNA polymerase specialized sigma24 family protein
MILNNDPEVEMRRGVWEQVCTDYYKPALDFARGRVWNSDEAQAVVHDSTVRLLRLLPDPRRIDDRRNYWIKVVQNQCNDLLKRQILAAARTVSLDTPLGGGNGDDDDLPPYDPPDHDRGPAMNAEINEQTEILLRELEFHCADLSEREVSLLALRLQGLDNDQIANAWGEDVKVIRADMNAVMAKIRYRLQHRERE